MAMCINVGLFYSFSHVLVVSYGLHDIIDMFFVVAMLFVTIQDC